MDNQVRVNPVLSATIVRGGRIAAHVDNNPATRRAALRALPAVLRQRFDAQAAGDLNAVVELRVSASEGGPEARFRLEIADGELHVTRTSAPEAQAWLSASLGDMIRIVSGNEGLWELLSQKRLDFGGEPFTALRMPAVLRL
ncbi:MAG: SCP2 sterol-binding domain-containing protein [Solirubrobacterales bacterium]|nr:SCP2 sterol-binding domain-containing protein [Solirubrobacterales bacterium]